MVESLKLSLDLREWLVFLVLSNRLENGVIKANFVVAEVGDEVAEVYLLDVDAGYDNVVVLVSGKSFLVVVEELDDLVVQLVEDGITDGGEAKFKSRWGVFPDVVEFGCITEQLPGNVLEASVVSWVDAAACSLDKFSKDVQTLGLVQGQESTLRSDDVSVVDGVKDSALEFADEFHQFIVVVSGSVIVMFITTREVNTVEITKMGFVWGLNVLVVVIEFLDGFESLTKTLEVVTGEQLLVNVVVVGTVANLRVNTFFASLLVTLGVFLVVLALYEHENNC